MIRYYRLDIKKFLTSDDEKIREIQEDAFNTLSEKDAEMTKLFLNGSRHRQERVRILYEKYGVKYKRMYEIYQASLNSLRDYLESEYPIIDLYEWFVFDFKTFFETRKERYTEVKLITAEKESILDLESSKDNMGIRSGKNSDTTSMKVVRLEQLENQLIQNTLCDAILTEIIEMSTEIERDIIDTFFLDRFQYKTMGYKVELLAQKYNLNISEIYKVRRKTMELLEDWVKNHYLYKDASRINFSMSRRWNLVNR